MKELTTKIRAFINGCNTRCAPFVWTNTADQVPTKENREDTSTPSHQGMSAPHCH
ncbi:hypothetical protein [Rhodococcus sp. IEGM 1307]|uniref:hypothetical protein n=1 Tax=Rhodococcus sp. IEGM 1307 TaxID=3047091 RepID=UPI0024B6A026|nr:hypothetical protein [Rhodococcus sp. IEGM 1307]MDI9975616.1 hypothetical protein [Rhodococcus sp. IEGM 1307]